MHYSGALLLLAILALVAGAVLTLALIVKSDEELEHERANTTRATLLLLASFTLTLMVVVFQRHELADSVKGMFA